MEIALYASKPKSKNYVPENICHRRYQTHSGDRSIKLNHAAAQLGHAAPQNKSKTHSQAHDSLLAAVKTVKQTSCFGKLAAT